MQCNYIHEWYCCYWLIISVSQMSNVQKRAVTDVNSEIYVCKSNRSTETIYNCSNLCCMSNTCTRSYWPHRSYTSIDNTGHTHLQYNRTHHTIQCCKEPFTHGPEQYRVQTPASAFTTISSPSEALSLLLAWSLPCWWRQTVAQPIRTSHLQTIQLSLATPHLQCGNASTLNK